MTYILGPQVCDLHFYIQTFEHSSAVIHLVFFYLLTVWWTKIIQSGCHLVCQGMSEVFMLNFTVDAEFINKLHIHPQMREPTEAYFQSFHSGNWWSPKQHGFVLKTVTEVTFGWKCLLRVISIGYLDFWRIYFTCHVASSAKNFR